MAVDAGGPTGGVRRGLGGRMAHRMWHKRRAQEQARLRQLATNEQPLPDSTTSNKPTKPSEPVHRNENDNNQNRNTTINAQCAYDNDPKMGEAHTTQQENMLVNCEDVSISDDSSIESDDSSEESTESEDESEEFAITDESDKDGPKEMKTVAQNNDSSIELPVGDNVSDGENNEDIKENDETSNEQGQRISNELFQVTSDEQAQGPSNEQNHQTSNEQVQQVSNEHPQKTPNEQSQGIFNNEQSQERSNVQAQEASNEQTQETQNEPTQETLNENAQGTTNVQDPIKEPERNSDNFMPFAEIRRLHQLTLNQKQFKSQVPEVSEVKTAKIIQNKSEDFPEWSDFLAMHEAKQKREYEEAVEAMSLISSEEKGWICEEWVQMLAICEEYQQHIVKIEEDLSEETSQKSDDSDQDYPDYQGREEKTEENSIQDFEDQQPDLDEEEYEAESIIEYDDFPVIPISPLAENNIAQENEEMMRKYEAMHVEIERKWLAAQKVVEAEDRLKVKISEREHSRNGAGCSRHQRTRHGIDRMNRKRARHDSDCLKREGEKNCQESERTRRERSRLEVQCAGIARLRNRSDRIRKERVSCDIERVKRECTLHEKECSVLQRVRNNTERDQRELERLEAECLVQERVSHEVELVKELRQQTENIKHELEQHEIERIERNWAKQEADHLKREKFRTQAERVLRERAQNQTNRVGQDRLRLQSERNGRERAQSKAQISERKRERRVVKRVERNRQRRGANCVEDERKPSDFDCVENGQGQQRLHWFKTLALIPIYQQRCQVAQRKQLAYLVHGFGMQRVRQICLFGALSDHMLELRARRENAGDTFSQQDIARQIQLSPLGGINRQDALQISLWEEFCGIRLDHELLLGPETRWERMSGFRSQREWFTTIGERREQVLSIFVRRIHKLCTPVWQAHTSRSIAQLQRILHMREALFQRRINNTEICFPVITIWEENLVRGFDLVGPLQDLEQYPIHDDMQRPQAPVQLELHVCIQYPIRYPLMVCPNLHLQDPDQAPGPATLQLLPGQSNHTMPDPIVNPQIAPLQNTTLQDPQQNQYGDFGREEEQDFHGQEQDSQQEQIQDPYQDLQQFQEQARTQSLEQIPEQVREPVRRQARRRNRLMRGHPLLFILFLLTPGFALHVKTCSSPLGMESGEILDTALTASSSYVSNVGPQCARLNKDHLGGGWCPKGQVEATSREYVEVDFGGPRLITGLATQGRHGQGRGVEYLEGYTIEYFRPSLASWHVYRRWDGNNVFSGNSDTVTVVQHSFTPPLHATNLRVYPHSLHLRTICLRMEVYGCEDDSGLLSYAAPAGSGDLGDHVDREYDGVDGEDGLGRLTDGQIGGDFFLIDIGYARGSGWVGWRNSSFPSGYLEITFTFDAIRNISQVNLFANNYHSRNVQVFRTAVVYFSVGGKYFNGDPVVFSQHPDKNNESARNVSIPFSGGRVAKYTKIRLYFQSEWIMLGEVYFTSEIIETNVTDEIHQKVFDDILELTLLNMDYDKSQYEPPTDLMIGSLTVVVLIVIALFLGMLVVHKRKEIGIFKRSNSYLGNDFSMKINMKDLFTNFTPGKDTAVDVLDSSPPSNYEARPPMIIRGELPGVAVGIPPCTLPIPPGNTLTRRKQSYVTATSPRRGKAVVTLAPPSVPRVPPADLTFRTLYGQRPSSSKTRDGPKYLDVSGGNMRGKAGGEVGWGGRNGSTDLLAISDLEDMHRRFLTPEQINNLTGAPAYVVWNIAPGLRNPRQEEDRVEGSDLPLSYLNLVSHSATGDLSSVDILQHSNFLCRRVSTIQNRNSRRHHSQELLELPYG